MAGGLTKDKAYVFRIVHIDNVDWILDNGLHCGNSATRDPNYVNIGNTELIEKRRDRAVPIAPGGTLSDYVPFYFTPYSPMMYNIKTGYGGITKRANKEIAILATSLHRLKETAIEFVFTNRHAYLKAADFYSDLGDLDQVDFGLLARRDFRRDPDDPEKVERYQAEALVHRFLPIESLLGVVCFDDACRSKVLGACKARKLSLTVDARPKWYF